MTPGSPQEKSEKRKSFGGLFTVYNSLQEGKSLPTEKCEVQAC